MLRTVLIGHILTNGAIMSEEKEQLEIGYKDDAMCIMENVNIWLEEYGLKFIMDEDSDEDIPSIFYTLEEEKETLV